MKLWNRVKLPKECPACGLNIKLVRQRSPTYSKQTYGFIVLGIVIAAIVYAILIHVIVDRASVDYIVGRIAGLILLVFVVIGLSLPKVRTIKCPKCGWTETYTLGRKKSSD
ncbi:MAG: hypothetical protein ACYTG7_04510 [Planctomycetota bacterium]|jgi:predicted RNA-binding Zn-ribbon protein involved in translation (DUF1610 family)